MAEHLLWLENKENEELDIVINDSFPDEQVFIVTLKHPLWYANYVVCGFMPNKLNFY